MENLISNETVQKAIKEAKNLNKYLTKTQKEEIADRYEDNTLDGLLSTQCVYGIATGNCNSPEAYELIKKCVEYIPVDSDVEHRAAEWMTPLEEYLFWIFDTYTYEDDFDDEEYTEEMKAHLEPLIDQITK